jgi:hypothetical protein
LTISKQEFDITDISIMAIVAYIVSHIYVKNTTDIVFMCVVAIVLLLAWILKTALFMWLEKYFEQLFYYSPTKTKICESIYNAFLTAITLVALDAEKYKVLKEEISEPNSKDAEMIDKIIEGLDRAMDIMADVSKKEQEAVIKDTYTYIELQKNEEREDK